VVVVAVLTAVVVAVAAILVTAPARRRARRVTALEAQVGDLRGAMSSAERTHERFGQALTGLSQGVVIFDEAGDVVFRNRAATRFFAARHSDALVEAAIVTLIADAVHGISAARRLDLYGPPRRQLELTGAPFEDGGGGLIVIDDVSERRRLDAMRRDFVANISHELKTPVGAIGILAETLAAEDDPAVARRLVERVLSEAHRVGRTIDDLLELSRLEAHEQPDREPVPVGEVLADAAERVSSSADTRGVGIRVDGLPPRVTAFGDRRQLVSALTNLCDNAVKYSDAGSEVRLRARTDGRTVELIVEDHGMGIAPNELERIFERFYRVDRGRSRETGGTGLGLAIVRHVASNHHGEVRVSSEEGQGSTFTLRLPAGPGPVALPNEEVG
jgi:two-component system sensor histidine kinase SenX3